MDDLLDLTWKSTGAGQLNNGDKKSNANYNIVALGSNNPFSQSNVSKSSTTTNANSLSSSPSKADSFGGLVNFGAKKRETLTLAQQAALLQAQRAEQTSQTNKHFANSSFFDQQLSRPSSTAPTIATTNARSTNFPEQKITLQKSYTETSEDILAEINGDRPVDRSSYYPPPRSPDRVGTNGQGSGNHWAIPQQSTSKDHDFFEDIHLSRQATPSISQNGFSSNDPDDILGDLGKPVQSFSRLQADDDIPPPFAKPRPRSRQGSSSSSSDDEDLRAAKAASLENGTSRSFGKEREGIENYKDSLVRQIVEMGFSARQAEVALNQTESGLDVEAAMELLLSLQGNVVEPPQRERHAPVKTTNPRQHHDQSTRPASAQSTGYSQSETAPWVDTTYGLASKTLATANTWLSNKSAMARRKLAEFNANQTAATYENRFDDRPKWMRDAEKHERKDKGKSKAQVEEDEDLREEGLPLHPAERKRLEMNGVLPAQSHSRRGSVDSSKSGKSMGNTIFSLPETLRSSISTTSTSASKSASNVPQSPASDSRRFKANDDEASSFTSSRRRRPAAQKEPLPAHATGEATDTALEYSNKGKGKAPASTDLEEDDLFGEPRPRRDKGKGKEVDKSSSTRVAVSEQEEEVDLFSAPKRQPTIQTTKHQSGRTTAAHSTKSRRAIPYLDATALATSMQNRHRGSEAFKRGDFAKALAFYDSSLQALPETHPIRVLSLTNRALTQIHLGSSKPAIIDCDQALQIIGPGNGANEFVDDSGKQVALSTLWAKAMTRKATALEMQERVKEALVVWQDLVKSGLAGSQAVEARQRCEKLTLPKPKPVAPKIGRAAAKPSAASNIAVQKLRDDNRQAAQDEARKDSLYSTVHAKINAWSAGKEQNLRALLSSLDQVLWPSSGWKKVTLADLVINSKVKVIYMKALAKVHPDKISRDASVEEKMVAEGVFSKLNGAWDSFKASNNM